MSEEKLDGWQNALTGIGLVQRDKRRAATIAPDLLDENTCEALWRGDDLGARIVDTLPNELLREGFDLQIKNTEDVEAQLQAQLDDLKFVERFRAGFQYERAYGGAAVFIGAEDGSLDLTMPLNLDTIKAVHFLTTFHAFELTPVRYYSNPLAPNFGEVEIYQIQPNALYSGLEQGPQATYYPRVHASRLLVFPGIRTSRRQAVAAKAPSWGDSIFVRIQAVLADYQMSWGSVGILLSDIAQAVFKIKDLAELIATDRDDVVVKRAQLIDMMRSTARAIILDSEEEFERKSTPLAGLEGLLVQMSVRLAAAADMPVTLLMGQSPAGLSATGASDVRFFYDRVRALQTNALKPKLERLLKIMMRASEGPTRGVEPATWQVVFRPLWQPTEIEKAQARLSQAQADQIYLSAGVVTPEEIAQSRFGGETYSFDTTLDETSRGEFTKADAEDRDAEESLVLQSIVIDKALADSLSSAIAVAKDFGSTTKYDETTSSYRFRQRPPEAFKVGSFRSIHPTEHVTLVMGKLK